jgi:hypothetical protein
MESVGLLIQNLLALWRPTMPLRDYQQEAIEIDKFFFFEIIAIPLAVFVVAYYTWKPVTRFMMKILRWIRNLSA